MIRMKPMSPAFTPNTFATGYWLQLTSVFNSTMSLFPKFLHLLFNFRWVWRLHRNLLCHLTQNSFVMCWMHLHLLLLNFQVSTNWQVGDNTTFDFIIRVLLGHSGSLLWAFPRVLTISNLEFDISSGSANSDSSLMILHVCSRETIECSMFTKFATPKHVPCDWMLLGFSIKQYYLHQYFEGNTEFFDDPFLWRCFLVLSALQQNWTHYYWAELWCSLF